MSGTFRVSRKFYAVHRETGERWKPSKQEEGKQYLVMYDSGYLAVVTEIPWNGSEVRQLDPKFWRKVMK